MKKQLEKLKKVGFGTFDFIDKTPTNDGTPESIEEEAGKRIRFVFKSERQALGPATRAALPADDDADGKPKRRGKKRRPAIRAALPADGKP